MIRYYLLFFLCSLGFLTSNHVLAAEKVLHVYNWNDYIAPNVIEAFEAETGIDVVYEVFDSNEALEGKLLAGNTGFDVVVPSASFLGRQVKAGVFNTIDKNRLTNYGNLDENLLQKLERVDPNNAHAIPYLWGTTGLGYNVKAVTERLGENAPLNSWDLLFNPKNAEKLADCGISMLDAPSEVLAVALFYLDKDPNSLQPDDYNNDAMKLMKKIRPYIKEFHSSNYIDELANGDICLAFGWSGDILQASARAEELGNEAVKVVYSLPQEGTIVWFDMLAIPKDAKNIDEAYVFIDYLLRPEVIAEITNYVAYANANKASTPLVDDSVRNNPNVYPSEVIKNKLLTAAVMPPKIDRVMTRVWTRIKTGL
jgi:putrescine transport system substrate-binding protein